MMKKFVAVILCLLLTISILPVKGIKNNSDFLKDGWLEVQNEVKILHVSGSNYEMGFQHGLLLKEEVKENLRAFLNYSNVSFDDLLNIWNIMKNYIPQDYIDEIQGIADGAEVNFEKLLQLIW